MRILFYGACHAAALKRIFDLFGPPGIATDFLENFRLMRDQAPFPYDSLINYDAVVFSPINRAGEYRTALLVEACLDRGVQTVSYPLVQWGGYFPGLVMGDLGRGHSYYPDLYRLALEYPDFSAFESFIVEGHTLPAAEAYAARCHTLLRRTEEIGEAQIGVAAIVEREFREKRMMLTATHPARALYCGIVRQLEQHLGVRMDPSFYFGRYEPQTDAKLPILPATVRALGLQFQDGEEINSPYFGDTRARSLRSWLKLYFSGARRAFLYEARVRTNLKSRLAPAESLAPAERVPMRPGDTVLGFELPPDGPAHTRIRVLDDLHGAARETEWFLHTPDWRRYDFAQPAVARRTG
jgi:hypothetical protein